MQAEYQDLESLLEVQRIDLMVMKLKKQRIELPQRIQVMRLRKKRDQIQAKLDQVLELYKKANAEKTAVEDEDCSLAERQARAQEIIDTAGSDFRKVESQSREMASTAKRREDLALKMVDIDARLGKINGVRTQLEDAVAASEAEEARLRAEFEADDTALADEVKSLLSRRVELMASIDGKLGALYQKTADARGGVGIGKLADESCGVCRTGIEGGRLISLKAEAPLGVCPNCKRLLVIEG